MKRSQIILIIVFLVLTGIIYMKLAANKKEYNKELKSEDRTVHVPVREVKNTMQTLTLTSYGQISANSEVIISSEVQGRLEKGDITMKPGAKFRKGDVLYSIDFEEFFYTLSAQKLNLSNLILSILPEIELDFPGEADKWLKFEESLAPGKTLPELPPIRTQKERRFLVSKNVVSQYFSLKSQEARIKKYTILAPFTGTVISTFAEPGSIANPGAQLAKITNTGEYEVKVPISLDDLSLYETPSNVIFTNSKGEEIGEGEIIRTSDVVNQQTQSADVYFSIKPLKDQKVYNGMFVNISINEKASKETMTIPRTALINGKVQLLKGEKISSVDVLVVDQKTDSLCVTGLKNGSMVLLEPVEDFDSSFKYKGVKR